MICPDCGAKMMKTAIQHDDCSGWMVGWLCECEKDDESIELVIHAAKDWTAEILSKQRGN